MQLSGSIPKSVGDEPFITRIADSGSPRGAREAILARGDEVISADGFRCVLRIGNATDDEIPVPNGLEYLSVGDIVRINRHAGEIRVLYRRSSAHNVLFFTERCNSRCLMCSQPPRAVDDGYLVEEILETIPLMSPETKELCITGGEPTLLGNRFLDVIEATKRWLPKTSLHVLSNGRLFSIGFRKRHRSD